MISFDEFLKQDEADKYNMLLECNAIIQQKENTIKEVREYILTHKLYCLKYDDEELFEIVTDKKVKDELLEKLGSDKEWK